jgi:hypothetical protein
MSILPGYFEVFAYYVPGDNQTIRVFLAQSALLLLVMAVDTEQA